MIIRELTALEFNNFADNNEYGSYHQTSSYALLKSSNNYEYEMIGYVDKEDNIYAAALVLVKLIEGYIYAYIPEGPLIDYSNAKLVNDFTKAVINYYKKESIVFIKINPRIVIGTIDNKTHKEIYNNNYPLISNIENAGWIESKEMHSFDSILPKYNAIVNLKNYSEKNLSKNTRNKIRKAERKGLTFEIGSVDKLKYLYEFTKRKTHKDEFYFNDYYNIFNQNNKVDFFLVSIDFEKYIENSQNAYEKELKKNQKLKDKVIKTPGTRNINTKMNSDKTLLAYKEDIAIASKYILENTKKYIAGALVVKHGNTITIRISGYDKKYASFSPNYFLYNEILNYYKDIYQYADLNGITGDLSKDSKYYGLNKFKLGFNPIIVEYAGEFEYINNNYVYNKLTKKGLIEKEFKNIK